MQTSNSHNVPLSDNIFQKLFYSWCPIASMMANQPD